MAREMKDSGIEWIGEIPSTWNTVRFKYLHDGLNTGEAIDKEFWSKEESDLVFYTAGLTPIRTKYLDFPLWKFTQANDILLARNGTPYVYFPTVGACYTDHIIRASMKQNVNRRFVQYALQQSIASVVVDSVSIATWSASLWNAQYLPWPTEEEQNRIVDFLDHKCAEIDSVIAKTQRTIEEYKSLKQSIITEAVTKGVRGERPMKDSGIEWIGEIPVEWEVTKFKKLGYCRNGLTYSPENQCGEEGTLVLRSSNIQNGMLDFSDCVYVNCSVRDDLMVRPNDILICSRNGSAKLIGKNAIIPDGLKASFGAFMMIYRCQSPKYIQYVLSSHIFSYYLGTFLTVSVNQLTGKNFDNIQFPYTDDYLEQEEIITYLDKKCSEIDRLIESKQQLLIELESYKKSVIYEYVTGKKEVPVCQ